MTPLAIGALAMFGLAAAAGEAAPRPRATPAAVPRPMPEKTWRATCGYCHGGPMRAPELRGAGLPDDYVIGIVRQGAAGMPPFHPSSIGDAELRALVRWIAAQPAPSAAPAPRP